jgi:hypothetical protein
MSEPPKFVKDASGVRKINPAWRQWDAQRSAAACVPSLPLAPNAATALPTVSTLDGVAKLGAQPAATATATQEILGDTDIARQIGLPPAQAIALLQAVMSKYEIPLGLANKLLGLSDYQFAECLVDDSGSMNMPTDTMGANGQPITRWQEVHLRLSQMIEIIACIPVPPFYIRFLNRADIMEIKKNDGETPQDFYNRAMALIGQQWAKPPGGTTPALERIRESLQRSPGVAGLRYFFGDGAPNGGAMAAMTITQLLITRPNPQLSPFTFMSCTNDTAQVQWMKEAEEAAPYCAELDDFHEESNEVLGDQGRAFPFSFGMYLVAQLVAAFNPDDLDAMDESVPFTKQTLDNLTGYVTNPQEYQYYFQGFIAAQTAKPVETGMDKLKKDYLPIWQQFYQHFVSAPLARQIPPVQAYHQAVAQVKRQGG